MPAHFGTKTTTYAENYTSSHHCLTCLAPALPPGYTATKARPALSEGTSATVLSTMFHFLLIHHSMRRLFLPISTSIRHLHHRTCPTSNTYSGLDELVIVSSGLDGERHIGLRRRRGGGLPQGSLAHEVALANADAGLESHAG